MIPELAHFFCVLAFTSAVALALAGFLGARQRHLAWVKAAKQIAIAQFLFLLCSFIFLDIAFLLDDFTVQYVADNSHTLLPWYYKASAMWGDHEGSFLLWTLVMAGWTAAVALRSESLSFDMRGYVLSVLGLINVAFLLFLLSASNPFLRAFPLEVTAGSDMNAILQDFGHLVHPPFLYLGYVGFSVAFAFAVAALLTGRIDAAWARWSRPWTNTAWALLTVGIALGSWWAYYELGWGGWWFWDPVENASFMPWLAGTALIHSLAVTEKRGAFKSWTVLLALLTFTLCLVGAFLVRSGVLTSVHAFAIDPERGMYLATIVALVACLSLSLYAFRAARLRSRISYRGISRELLLLANNALLTLALAVIFLYTLYPLFYEWLTDGGRVSLGPPYFNRAFVPLMMLLAGCLALVPIARWKRTPLSLFRPSLYILGGAFALGLFVPLIYSGALHIGVTVCIAIALWILSTHLADIYRSRRSLTMSFLGMSMAHMGFAITVIGVTITSGFSVSQDLRLSVGDEVRVGDRTYVFEDLRIVNGPNYVAHQAQFVVGDVRLLPERRQYTTRNTVTTEAAIRPGFTNDLLVSLGEPVGDGAWAVRIQEKPMIRWVWLGAVIAAMAGLLAVFDVRYRRLRLREARLVQEPQLGGG
ncbi:MAG: heme lyase CcmF/NrfE family subunit [Gammaproteobacteria bacterium]|nr:heme lyase CcmF/NrfE family subunit [Gammaproteobacteria bacterium]